MDQDSAHMVAASKVPMLKPGEYEIWRISEMLDQTFDRLQKLISQLEILDEKLSQEDVNQKLLRSLSLGWNTHAVVWRNKADLDTMSMDDLYNNLKVYEPEVKGMSSSSSSTQNMAFVSSLNNNTSSTNEAVNTAQVVNTAQAVNTASTQVNDAYSTNIDNLSDAIIFGFFASQPNSPQLVHEDLQQIYPDDMEEMDLRWKMALQGKLNEGVALVEISTSTALCHVMVFGPDLRGGLKKFEIHIGEITIKELRKKLEIVQKEKDGIQLNVDKFEHASKSLNKLIECQIVDNCKNGLGYENYKAFENCKAMSSEEVPKVVRKYDDAPSIEEWMSDDEEEDVSQPKTEKKIVRPSIVKNEFVKSKQQEKTTRKTVKQVEQHRQNTHSQRGNQRN
ncbi:hypothetical protein Tco_1428693 [Tanacetum coccineum]